MEVVRCVPKIVTVRISDHSPEPTRGLICLFGGILVRIKKKLLNIQLWRDFLGGAAEGKVVVLYVGLPRVRGITGVSHVKNVLKVNRMAGQRNLRLSRSLHQYRQRGNDNGNVFMV